MFVRSSMTVNNNSVILPHISQHTEWNHCLVAFLSSSRASLIVICVLAGKLRNRIILCPPSSSCKLIKNTFFLDLKVESFGKICVSFLFLQIDLATSYVKRLLSQDKLTNLASLCTFPQSVIFFPVKSLLIKYFLHQIASIGLQ